MGYKNLRNLGGPLGDMARRADAGLCPVCHKPVNIDELRDAISRKEFGLSGMCQACQDNFFGKD